MPKVITTKSIAGHIEEIISSSNAFIVIVSPYMKLDQKFMERLRTATQSNIELYVCYRSNELQPNEMNFFKGLENCQLLPIDYLHSKYFFNEKGEMVIGSMNLSEVSERKNWELGIFVDPDIELDEQIMVDAATEFRTMLISCGYSKVLEDINKYLVRIFPVQYKKDKVIAFGKEITTLEFEDFHVKCNVKTGFCIRCGIEIPYYPQRPYCPGCFRVWSKYNNRDHEEKQCHRCSRMGGPTINEPQCEECEVIYQFEIAKEYDETIDNQP